MGVKKNVKNHRDRKSPGSRDVFNRQRAERNEARPKQRWVESTLDGKPFTLRELDNISDEQISRIVPAHWERP